MSRSSRELLVTAEVESASSPSVLSVSALSDPTFIVPKELPPPESSPANNTKEESFYQRHKQLVWFLAGCSCALIIIVPLVVVTLVVRNKNRQPSGPTPAPSIAPTTLAPTATSLNYIILKDQMAAVLDDPSQLSNTSSPYHKALQWMVYEDQTRPDRRHLIQRYLLAAFYYFASEQHTWKACSPSQKEVWCEHSDLLKNLWLSPFSECNWAGLGCHADDDALRRIELMDYELNGKLLPELGKLYRLETLDLRDNPELVGSIPTSLGESPELRKLLLSGGNLSGPLPHQLCSATSMKTMSVSGNALAGTIPTCLDQLTQLKELQLDDNQFTGNIPSTLGRLSNLQEALFHDNMLTGSIPAEICVLSQAGLTELRIDCGGEDLDNYVACSAATCTCDCS